MAGIKIIYGKYCLVLLSLILALPTKAFSQNSMMSEGIIIQCDIKKIATLKERWNASRNQQLYAETLGEISATHLLKSDDDELLYRWCKDQPEILRCEYNAILKLRSMINNDPDIDSQYYLKVIRAFDAWAISKGGKKNSQDDIIVAVIDNGFDLTHEDLKDAVYINNAEINGDGIDNDGNGLIDDVSGWNIASNNSKHFLRVHGTNVMGVLAATHNNSKGIAGVHPNVKIYPISTIEVVSQTILAYELIIKQKKLFLESGGQKGLNISVVNHSSGLDFAFAKDFPIWCGLYDKMGELGILSVVATSNDQYNVDSLGDMPSTCTSPYTIVVNGTNRKDEFYESGYGAGSVDLSAPAEKIYTTHPMFIQPYFYSLGTSMATPMVAGAVSILYSIPCDSFQHLFQSESTKAILALKDIILASTDKRTTLASRSVSQGRLNMYRAVTSFQERFNCSCHLVINKISHIGDDFAVDFFSGYKDKLQLQIFDSSGKSLFNRYINPQFGGTQSLSIEGYRHHTQGIRFLKISDEKCTVTKGFSVLGY